RSRGRGPTRDTAMTVTFTPAAERIARHRRERSARFGRGDLVLVATSFVVALAIGLAYAGRFATLADPDRGRASAPINLMAVDRAELLEPGLTTAFPDTRDREFAAREWWEFLARQREGGRTLPNVGAAGRATVAVGAIQRNPQLDAFARRLTA